jgi:hypothetical protein
MVLFLINASHKIMAGWFIVIWHGSTMWLKRSGNMPKVTASNGRASNSTPGLTQTPCSFHSHTASRVNKDAVNPVSGLPTHKLEVTTRKLVSWEIWSPTHCSRLEGDAHNHCWVLSPFVMLEKLKLTKASQRLVPEL